LARLHRSGSGIAHSVYFADITRLAEMKRVAAEIANREPPIDILINNAGALFGTRRLTDDGLEYTFALNHMSYFVVTDVLRERLLASRAGLIINTASAAHQSAIVDFDDLQSAKSYRAMRAYSCSKLCNILFTRELARRLHSTDATVNCLHPGFVATRFADEAGGLVSRLAWLAKFFAISPCRRRSNDHLSRVVARGGQCDRKILLQVSSDHAVGTGVGRPCCFGIVGAQCCFGGCEGVADALIRKGSRRARLARG
jgi:NAD(P)-dependent dehydrogenase (short-subunit alcohol dehydrogenase family)